MTYEIIFLPKAEETYSLIVAQLMQRWGERFVIKFEDKVTKQLMLSVFRLICIQLLMKVQA